MAGMKHQGRREPQAAAPTGAPRAKVAGWLPIVVALGCGSAGSDPPGPPPPEGPACDALELVTPSGRCVRPGIAESECAEGFAHDGGYGCEPQLTVDCPDGTMSVPGDVMCQPVMPCGAGKWGDIPRPPSTQHVDGSYLGGDADGSADRPWPTIGQGLAAATAGATIAVAAGSYAENLAVTKPVELRGVCPDLVELVPGDVPTGVCPPTAVCLVGGADGSVVSGLTVRGGFWGMSLTGVYDVVVEHVRIVGSDDGAIVAADALGPGSLTVRRVLIEDVVDSGLYISGFEVLVEATEVRRTAPDPVTQLDGSGLLAELLCTTSVNGTDCSQALPTSVTVRTSVFDQNHFAGVMGAGATIDMAASVVRRTLPSPASAGFGVGVLVQPVCTDASSATGCDPTVRASLHLADSLVADNHKTGVAVVAADAVIDGAVIRDTLPSLENGTRGNGVDVTPLCLLGNCVPDTSSTLTLTRSLVERNRSSNVIVVASTGTVERTVLRDGQPRAADGKGGAGVVAQPACVVTDAGTLDCFPGASALSVRDSMLTGNRDVSAFSIGSKLELVSSLIEETSSRDDGKFGDGLAVVGSPSLEADGSVSDCRIENSSRAGVAAFGATLVLQATRLQCAAFGLTGEVHEGQDFEILDGGDNLCGCPTADSECKVITANLAPPTL